MVWFNKRNNEFLLQAVNYSIEMLELDLCYGHSIMTLSKHTLKKYKHEIVKINNLTAISHAIKKNKVCNILDLSLGKQNKLTGSAKNTNLQNLITFFNESTWINSKEVSYSYSFSFKRPSSAIKRWVFEIYKKHNNESDDYFIKKRFNEEYEFIFNPLGIMDKRNKSPIDIFQRLVERNVFSVIKNISSMHMVDSDFLELLVIRTMDYIDDHRNVSPFYFIDSIENVYFEWVEKGKERFNTTILDCDILKEKVSLIFNGLEEISEVIYDYLFMFGGRDISDDLLVKDFKVIVRLIDLISKLPKSISSNFSFGWAVFSTGELAKLNIFSSIYNHIKKIVLTQVCL